MNRLQIITDARALMAEKTASSSYADATDVTNWINEGIKDMCIKGKVYQKSLSLTVVTTIAAYNLPWEFIDPFNVLNYNGVPLTQIENSLIGGIFKITGKPTWFYFTQSAITLSAWQVNYGYVIWPATGVHTKTYLVPTVPNGYMYECIIAGTSHATTEPTWSTVLGTKQTDGTVTWICRELVSSLQTINFYDTPTTAGGGVGTYTMLYSAQDSGLITADDKASPSFPERFHSYLVPYICYRWSIKNRDAQLAAAFYQEYAAGVGLPQAQPQGVESAS